MWLVMAYHKVAYRGPYLPLPPQYHGAARHGAARHSLALINHVKIKLNTAYACADAVYNVLFPGSAYT